MNKEISLIDNICKGNLQKVKSLLQNGVNVNTKGGTYITGIGWAIINKNYKMIKLLMDFNADLNIYISYKFMNRTTPLHLAIKYFYNLKIIKYLLKFNINFNNLDSGFMTVLEVACLHNRLDLLPFLLNDEIKNNRYVLYNLLYNLSVLAKNNSKYNKVYKILEEYIDGYIN